MKQASAFSVINNRGSLRLQEPKMEQTLMGSGLCRLIVRVCSLC